MSDNLIPTNAPKSKVLAATGGAAVGSAIAIILIWAIQKAGIELPPNVADALSIVVSAVLTFASGWSTPPGAGETNITGRDGSVRSAAIPATPSADRLKPA